MPLLVAPLRNRLVAAAIALIIVGAILLVGWPAIHGFWVRDDLTQLAYVRLLGSPWPLFVTDHFPVPGSIFRPLGFASLWLSERLFGNDFASNSVADLVLHGLVVLALYRLMRVSTARAAAFACCLLFALLPVVLATVMSWSNRFDLLAVLFTLITLRSVFDWIRSERLHHLLVAPVAMLAALLSKESGAIAVVGAALVIGDAALGNRMRWRRAALGFGAIGLVGVGYVIWRRAILGPATNAITGDGSLVETLARGSLLWWQHLGAYVGASTRVPLLAVAALVIVLVMIAASWQRSSQKNRGVAHSLALVALAVIVLPGILQSPITVLTAVPATAGMSPVELGMQARLYYTACCGFALLLALGIEIVRNHRKQLVVPAVVSLFVLVGIAAVSSHSLARAHAQRSLTIAAPARGVVDYIAAHPLPQTRCRVVILGYQPPPEWANVTPLDSVIKALVPDLDRVSSCLFANEHKTYIHQFAAGRVTPGDLEPWRPRLHAGQAMPWLHVGGLEIAYLDPPAQLTATDRADILFLAIDADHVIDVSAAVRARVREVHLH